MSVIPLTDEGYAKQLYHTEAWSWLVQYVEEQITHCKDSLVEVSSMEEHQRIVGNIEGLRKTIDRVFNLIEEEV